MEKHVTHVRIWSTGEVLPYELELIQVLFDNGLSYTLIYSDGSTTQTRG
jgi:hypothetical protein